MKLRNKKTGGLANIDELCVHTDAGWHDYNSLAELSEEWEDWEETEESKDEWFITEFGNIHSTTLLNSALPKWNKERLEIGNSFETEEEAEKAGEKLKAWKRLKDKGFDIEGWDNHIGDNYYKTGQIVINLNNVKNRDWDEYDNIGEIKEDLDLLFGGKE